METPFDIDCGGVKYQFVPPMMQNGNPFSTVKTYCLIWMLSRGKQFITFDEIMDMPVLKNLQNTEEFKLLKETCWAKEGDRKNKRMYVEDFVFMKNFDRFSTPCKNGLHTEWRDRMLMKAKKIAQTHFTIVKDYASLTSRFFKHKFSMTFEVDHKDMLRLEPAFAVNYEVYLKQNAVERWPKTSNPKENIKFGWITFTIDLSRQTVHIAEIQCPAEMVNKNHNGEIHYFIQPMNWSGFMLQRFIQKMALRGFTRFTLPTVETRKKQSINKDLVESLYRELPKKMGFEKREDKGGYDLWWLDFNL